MRSRYAPGVSSFGGSTVSSRHSTLPSACARVAMKPSCARQPCKMILRKLLFLFIFLRSGNFAPLTHAVYSPSSAAARRCAVSPKTAITISPGFSPSSDDTALRIAVCRSNTDCAESITTHATSVPAASTVTGALARSASFVLRLASAASSAALNGVCTTSEAALGNTTSKCLARFAAASEITAACCSSLANMNEFLERPAWIIASRHARQID